MKGDSKVIAYLNKALGNELVAINQYFLHSRMFKDWGLKELADYEYCESVGDYISRELMEDILESEEEHIDWLETQLSLIDKVGIQNYQQSMMGSIGS